MKKIFLSLFILISFTASAQWTIINGNQRFVKGLGIPVRDTIITGVLASDSAQIVLRPQDSTLYVRYKGRFRKVGAGGAGSQDLQSVLNNGSVTYDGQTIDLKDTTDGHDYENFIAPNYAYIYDGTYALEWDTYRVIFAENYIDTGFVSTNLKRSHSSYNNDIYLPSNKINTTDTLATLRDVRNTNNLQSVLNNGNIAYNKTIQLQDSTASWGSTAILNANNVPTLNLSTDIYGSSSYGIDNILFISATAKQCYIYPNINESLSGQQIWFPYQTHSDDTLATLADVRAAGTIDTTSLSNRINLRVQYTDTATMLSPYLRLVNYGLTKSSQTVSVDTTKISTLYQTNLKVPYTGATSNVDLGAFNLNAQAVKINGTNGAGHIDLKHQASDATSTGSSTTLFANSNGDLKWKNDGQYYTTLTTQQTADRVYTFQNKSYTLGDSADVSARVKYTDTATMLAPYTRQKDVIPMFVFGAGSGAAGDTAAFSTSAIYGAFYNSGNDTIVVTSLQIGLQGTSPSINATVYFNDSLAVTAGATKLVNAGNTATNIYTGTSVTSFDNTKIPPGNWVWVQTGTVTTKPTFFCLTLIGYKSRL